MELLAGGEQIDFHARLLQIQRYWNEYLQNNYMWYTRDLQTFKTGLHVKIEEILERVATVASAQTDSAIARALELTPQAIGSARKRGTIPFEKICLYAEKKGLSIDYLLLGQGFAKSMSSPVGVDMLAEIAERLEAADKKLRNEHDIPLLPSCWSEVYSSGEIYNQVLTYLVLGNGEISEGDLIDREIDRLVNRQVAEFRRAKVGFSKGEQRISREHSADESLNDVETNSADEGDKK